MSGFKPTAIAMANALKMTRPIILMNGEEASLAFNNYVSFDELIRRKRLYLDKYSDPYHIMKLEDSIE
jgi:hypothetical protein